tara:strand:+ start:1209 stop:1751 length:543 start_codon:yes stop_codon:yes gene_type:complete
MPDDHYMFERMVSYWNLNPAEHRAKTACWLSHYNILKKISEQRLMRCIVVEDDAQQMSELPDPHELGNEFCYLGGYFSNLRLTKGPLKDKVLSKPGLNELNRETHRMLMTVSYYIPHYEIATKIITYLDSLTRIRAIDCMLHAVPVPMNYYYPALFVETPGPSTIRQKKRKHPNTEYMLV